MPSSSTQADVVRRFVHAEMRVAAFRELLVARDGDGNRPVVCASITDRARDVLNTIVGVGGTANLVVGAGEAGGLLVMPVTVVRDIFRSTNDSVMLMVNASETVADFLRRFADDPRDLRPKLAGVELGKSVKVPVAV